jgi:hypothetical protein
VFSEDQTYPIIATMLTKLGDEEPSLQFDDDVSADAKDISVFTADGTTVVVSAKSKSGKCFSFKNVATAGVGTTEHEAASGVSCVAASTPPTGTTPPPE